VIFYVTIDQIKVSKCFPWNLGYTPCPPMALPSKEQMVVVVVVAVAVVVAVLLLVIVVVVIVVVVVVVVVNYFALKITLKVYVYCCCMKAQISSLIMITADVPIILS